MECNSFDVILFYSIILLSYHLDNQITNVIPNPTEVESIITIILDRTWTIFRFLCTDVSGKPVLIAYRTFYFPILKRVVQKTIAKPLILWCHLFTFQGVVIPAYYLSRYNCQCGKPLLTFAYCVLLWDHKRKPPFIFKGWAK